MTIFRALLVALLFLPTVAFGQSAVSQAGPPAAGHAPMYLNSTGGQVFAQDSGPARGGKAGVGLSELLLAARGTGTPPYSGQGTGPYGTNFCDYDAPITNPTGYHFLCMSPNVGGNALIAIGASGSALPGVLNFDINGSIYQFPYTIGGIVGPSSSTVNDFACWNNTAGSLLKDCQATSVFDTAVSINTTGLADVPLGSRGPLFVWANPSNTTNPPAGGAAAGIDVFIGKNPTANIMRYDQIAGGFFITNGNYRGNYLSNGGALWGLNIGVVQCDAADCGADFIDSPAYGIEVDIANSHGFTASNTSFGAGGGGLYSKTAYQAISDGNGPATSAMMSYAEAADGSNWWINGLELSRILQTGIHFLVNPGGGTDTGAAFATAAIEDDSNSNIFLYSTGTHARALLVDSGTSQYGLQLAGTYNINAFQSPGFSVAGNASAVTDLYTTPPPNLTGIGGNGAFYSICSTTGCNHIDELRSSNVIEWTTLAPAPLFETGLIVNSILDTGYVHNWAATTGYVAGDYTFGSDLNIFLETVATCTSGSVPPSGTGVFVDGTCSWTYQASDIFYGKAGAMFETNVESANAPQAAWGVYTNLSIAATAPQTNFWAALEVAVTNAGPGCTSGVQACWGILIDGFVGNPGVAAIEIAPQGSGPGYAWAFGLNFQNWTASDSSIWDNSNSAVNSYYDTGVHQYGLNLSGTYSLATITSPGFSVDPVGNVTTPYVKVVAVAIASLPACSGVAGAYAAVNNGIASPTYHQAVSATGAAFQPVFCNGTAWIYN